MTNGENNTDAQSLSRAGMHEPAASCSCQVTLRSEKRPDNRGFHEHFKNFKNQKELPLPGYQRKALESVCWPGKLCKYGRTGNHVLVLHLE